MINGRGTNAGWLDDVYRINGTGNGDNSNGQSFNAVITNIVRPNICRWIVSGSIAVTPSGRMTRTIDSTAFLAASAPIVGPTELNFLKSIFHN